MDNVELIRRVYAAFAAGDVPGVVAAFDPNIEWHLAEHNPYWPGKALVGAQAVVEGVFVRLLEDFGGFRLGVAGRLDWSRASVDSASVRAKRGGTTLGKPHRSWQAGVQDPPGQRAPRPAADRGGNGRQRQRHPAVRSAAG